MTRPIPEDTPATSGAPDASRNGRGRWIVLAMLVPVVLVGAFVIGDALGADDGDRSIRISDASSETRFEHDFTIPAGTADRIAAGEQIAVVPAELVVGVGESIRIVNEDDHDHYVGVFFVAAGETLSQTFRSAGVLEDSCTVHSGGTFRLRVLDG